MECKLALSVFRFDAKTDFLPYYKTYFVTIDPSKSIHELLGELHRQDIAFDYPKTDIAAIKINGKSVFTNVSIDGVTSVMGKEWTLEPLSTKRATKDMIVDTDDFYQRFDLLAPYVDAKDKPLFEQYIIYHYASSVFDFVDDFQGDALFAFAYDMIEKHPEQKEKILRTIANEKTGIFLHVRFCNKIYPCGADVQRKITALKNEIIKLRPYANTLVEKLSQRAQVL